MKPDNDFFLPFEGMADFPEGGAGPEFWEHVSDLLEQIEKNTRAISPVSSKAINASSTGRATRVVERPSREHGKSVLPLSQTAAPRTAKAERAAFMRVSLPTPPPSPAARPSRGQMVPPANRFQGNSRAPSQVAQERPQHAESAGAATSTSKSQQEHTRRREEAVANEQSKGVLGILKKNLAGWDGSVAAPDKGDLQNAAGLAAGGPVWSAIKEVKEAVESSDDDDSSLSGILKKTLADKTGVTGAKERLERAKDTARAKVVSWAGGSVEDDGRHQGKAGRDKNGRFLKTQATSPETKLAEESYTLATREAAADKKRHDELVEAVKGSGNGAPGSGLLGEGGILDRVRGRGGVYVPNQRGKGNAPTRRRGWRGSLAKGGVFAGSASILAGGVSDLALDAGASLFTSSGAGKAVATTAGKSAGGLGKVVGLGSKGAAGAAKAIPVAGQLLAAGMAIYDGVQGWSNADMQKQAFGLTDGQEASTGQKASTAAANVLDMGGLFTGAAGLLGFDVSTADMAKGIYGMGDAVGSSLSSAWSGVTGFLSGDNKPAENGASAPITSSSDPTVKNNGEGFFDGLVAALSGLTAKIDEEIKKKESESSLMPKVGGFFSGVSSWIGSKVSPSGGQASGGNGKRSGPVEPTSAYSGLGDVVNMGETGGKGTAMISSGAGDHGGVSYGRSQLASKVGSIDAAMKWAKSNGYEDIYNELAPLSGDATSRNGQFAQKWGQMAQEKGGRLEQFDKAYQKQGYFDPMMAKIRTANPELAKRIEANPALQEQVLSTAVQYGPNSGRYLSAAGEVLSSTPNVTDRDLLAGVQDIKARDARNNFKSSSGAVQNSVARRHGVDEKQRLLAVQDRFEKGEIVIDPNSGTARATGKPSFAQAPQDAVEATSRSLQVSTQDAVNSGWVTEMNRAMMEDVNSQAGKEVYSKEARAVLQKGANGGAAGIIQSVSQATGELMGNAELAPENIREGMMIGMDTGNKGWDAGRFGGIDHIVQTYKDAATGRMMVSESSSGQGVKTTDYEEWYKKWNGRAQLYGTDATKLADAEAVKKWGEPQEEKTAIASASPGQQEKASSQAGTPAVPFRAEKSPVQVAAVQELPPQSAPRYPDPEPIRPNPAVNTAGADASAQMVALLSQLLDVTKQQGQKQERDTESANTPNIPMEYDNAYCANIAHDRA